MSIVTTTLTKVKCNVRYSTYGFPVQLFHPRMHNYATLCDKFIQHYATLCNPQRYIAAFLPPYRRERPFSRR